MVLAAGQRIRADFDDQALAAGVTHVAALILYIWRFALRISGPADPDRVLSSVICVTVPQQTSGQHPTRNCPSSGDRSQPLSRLSSPNRRPNSWRLALRGKPG